MKKKIKSIIETIVFIIIFIVCILVVFQSVIFKNKSIYGYRTYVIASNSMYPFFEIGDVILVKETDFNTLKKGDIITYAGKSGEMKDKIITHEIIDVYKEKNKKILKTKGRANTGIDPNVYENQVYGKFCYKFVIISLLSKIVRNDLGFIFLVFIPFIFLFILEIYNLIKESKRKELEQLVKDKLDELKKIDGIEKEKDAIEETLCLQLNEIEQAKNDYKKICKLEKTFTISYEQFTKDIEKLKNSKINDEDFEETVLLKGNDLKKAIEKEIKIRDKNIKKKQIKKTKRKKKYH